MKENKVVKLLSLLFCLMLVVGSLAGCTKDNKEETVKTETKETKTEEKAVEEENKEEGLTGDFEVQLFVGGFGDQLWLDALEGFQAENPNLNIIKNMGPKINDQMNTRWLSNNPPDFIYIDGPGIPVQQLIQDGRLMDLTEWFDTTSCKGDDVLIKDKLLDNILKVDKENNGIFQAPMLFSSWGVWYDATLFEKEGLNPPTNYDEVLALGDTLKSKNIAALNYTGMHPVYITDGIIVKAFASENVEDYIEFTKGNPEFFKTETFKKTMGKLKTLADKGYILDGTVALSHTQAQMEWLNNRSALIPVGLWLEKEMEKDIPTGFKMRFIPSILQDADQNMTIIPYGVSVAVAENAKNKEAALAFLEYLYRNDTAKSFVKYTGTPSAVNIDIANENVSDVIKSVQEIISNPNVKFVQSDYTVPEPINKVLGDVVNAVVIGEYTVEQAIEKCYDAAVEYNNYK